MNVKGKKKLLARVGTGKNIRGGSRIGNKYVGKCHNKLYYFV